MLPLLLLCTVPSPGPQDFADPVPLDGTLSTAERVIAADLDGDGLDDTVALDTRTGTIHWARSRAGAGPGQALSGGGSLEPAPFVPLFDTAIGRFDLPAEALKALDVDGDGDLDLVALGTPQVSTDPTLYVALGDGSGRIESVRTFSGSSIRARSMETIDLDGDGRMEIVVLGIDAMFQGTTTYYQNLGSGNFAGPGTLFTSTSPRGSGLRKGDLDGDGDEDLLMLNAELSPGSGVLALVAFPNNGSLPLDPSSAIPIGGLFTDVEVGDLTGNGLADLLTVDTAFQASAIPLINQGGFGFAPAAPLPGAPGESSFFVTLADLEGDGDLDVIHVLRQGVASPRVDLL